MDWMSLVILIANTIVTVLTNFSVNSKRNQTRNTD
ncbi:MAG: hypothetical protein [Microvirus sp.]|nr:MAG: hypothetical protein [Microvirus sp.]WNK14945.1 MAG: hypothetical protein [Microvirus sp.]